MPSMSENTNNKNNINHINKNKEETVLKTLFDFQLDKSDNTHPQTQTMNLIWLHVLLMF